MPQPWRLLTEADLLTRLSGTELESFRAAALGDGQDDPVEFILEQTADEVRGYIAANSANVLGAPGTLPSKLMSTAVDLALVPIMTRAAGLMLDPADARMKAKEAALQRLRDVARGFFAVEEPEEPDADEAPAAPKPSYAGRTRTFSDQSGV